MGAHDGKTLIARVLPLEYPYTEGESIWPCYECLPWHVEVYLHP